MEELAATIPGSSAYIKSADILKDRPVFEKLCKILGLDRRSVEGKIRRRGDAFTTIKYRLTPMEEAAVEELNSAHAGVAPQPVRYYPKKSLAGPLLGFVSTDGSGIGGLEYKYEELLRGREIWIDAEKDAKSDHLIADAPDAQNARGHSLILTLDQHIQHIAEDELEKGVAKTQAKGGFVVIMRPSTGEILAMAQSPQMNPNDFGAAKPVDRNPRMVTQVFEPGSTLKSIFMAVLLDNRAAKPSESVYCEDGEWRAHGRTIHDHVPHEMLTLAEVLKVSSNIGVAKLSERMNKDTFYEGYLGFGLGQATGVELGGESRGILAPPKRWSKVTPLTIAYGQGVSVTALQLTSAMSTLANNGLRMRPYLVKEVLAASGNVVERTEPEKVGQAVSGETARIVMKWMVDVVHDEDGTGTLADGSGYTIAGKTGTAWKPDLVNGGYNRRKVIASFMGAAPASAPEIAMLVTIDEPSKGSRYGGMVAAPVFREITRRVLTHLNVPPERKVEVASKQGRKKSLKRTGSKGRSDIEVADAKAIGKMPNLKGLTIRQALRKLEKTGVSIRLDLVGSGFAVRQEPKAGTVLAQGAGCRLEFESPLASRRP